MVGGEGVHSERLGRVREGNRLHVKNYDTVSIGGIAALSKNIVIYHRGERRVLGLFQSLLTFLMALRSPCALR